MPVAVDYDLTIREADKALRAATTADDVRNVWKKHMGVLGHRTLGRLLLGRSAAELIAKRDDKEDTTETAAPVGVRRAVPRDSAPPTITKTNTGD